MQKQKGELTCKSISCKEYRNLRFSSSCNTLTKVHYQFDMVSMGLGRKPVVIMSYIEYTKCKMSIATCPSSIEVQLDKYMKY